MHLIEIFQSNRKSNVDGRHQILHFEIDEFHIVTKLLDDSRKFSRCQICIMLISSASADEFTTTKNQRSAARLTYPHHNAVKSLWIVFGVSSAEIDFLEIQFTAQGDTGYAVLNFNRADGLLRT